MREQAWIYGLALAGWLFLSGCPNDCEVACGKLEFCGLLEGGSRTHCNDTCEEDEATASCADCLENTGCGSIANGNCTERCAGSVEIRKP